MGWWGEGAEGGMSTSRMPGGSEPSGGGCCLVGATWEGVQSMQGTLSTRGL